MNTISNINTEYLRPSRTIETILVSNAFYSKIFYLYNYEGNSFRLFKTEDKLIQFFEEKAEEDFHFGTEEELDDFLMDIELEMYQKQIKTTKK